MTAATTTSTDSPSHGGEPLLALMAFAVIAGSTVIALLGVFGSWWLLPVAMGTVIVFAIAVAYTLMHLMSDGDAAAAEEPTEKPAAAPLARVASA
jgi:fatty acid desaturase